VPALRLRGWPPRRRKAKTEVMAEAAPVPLAAPGRGKGRAPAPGRERTLRPDRPGPPVHSAERRSATRSRNDPTGPWARRTPRGLPQLPWRPPGLRHDCERQGAYTHLSARTATGRSASGMPGRYRGRALQVRQHPPPVRRLPRRKSGGPAGKSHRGVRRGPLRTPRAKRGEIYHPAASGRLARRVLRTCPHAPNVGPGCDREGQGRCRCQG
jgi:hypothetical protein